MSEHFAAGPEILQNVPETLRQGKRFVAYRLEDRGDPKPAKVPRSPDAPKGASSTAPADWTTFDAAVGYARVAGLDGVMRAFDPADGLVGIDKDNCRNPETGELTEDAAELVKRIDSYTEVSPSGTGIHIWVYASLPPRGRHKRGVLEMYDRARFFTLTGRHVEGTPTTVCYRPDAVAAIHRETFGAAQESVIQDSDQELHGQFRSDLDDDAVIRTASESPHNGARFNRLWSGDTSDYASESEADAALCELLGFYGGPDRERIERLWLASVLGSREKVQRADYRERTIDLALKGKTRFYGDDIRPPAATGTDRAEGCACESCPALQEVGRLQRRALDQDDQIEALRTCNATLSTKLTAALERLDGWKTILSNKHLKPVNRIAAIPITEGVTAARANGQAEVHVRYPGIVNAWGVSESAVSDTTAILTTSEGAPMAKRNGHDRIKLPNGETATPRMTIIRPVAAGDLYAAVGTFDPKLPQRGGKRDPIPECPDHPDADVLHRSVDLCKTCRKRLAPPVERTLCRQNEGIDGGPGTTVDEGTYCRQNEGIDDLAARRAQAVRAIPMGRAVDKWKRPERPKDDQEDGPGFCKVHGRAFSPTELEDGGCSWCVTESAAAGLFPDLPAAVGVPGAFR